MSLKVTVMSSKVTIMSSKVTIMSSKVTIMSSNIIKVSYWAFLHKRTRKSHVTRSGPSWSLEVFWWSSAGLWRSLEVSVSV